MKLATELKTAKFQDQPRSPLCAVGRLLELLDADDRRALVSTLADSDKSGASIGNFLSRFGKDLKSEKVSAKEARRHAALVRELLDCSGARVRYHRRRICKCPDSLYVEG